MSTEGQVPGTASSPTASVPGRTAGGAAESGHGRASATVEGSPDQGRTIVLATTETGAGLDFVQSVAATYGAASDWTIKVIGKEQRELRADIETAALAGQMPDLLWTHGENIGPLVAAELLLPAGDFVELAQYVPLTVAAASVNGAGWGVPIATGDHLVLFYNLRWLPEPPSTTDALLALQKPEGVEILLAADLTSPRWMAAWLGGFGGITLENPTRLSSPGIVSTIFFLKELRDRGLVASDMDTGSALETFRSGRAAMLVANAWSLGTLTSPQGDAGSMDLGVTALPVIAATGQSPKTYASGTYLLATKATTGEKLEMARGLATFLASPQMQARVARELRRLPATNVGFEAARLESDPYLPALAATITGAVPLPTGGMPKVLDASLPVIAAALNGEKSPREAAQEIQTAAEPPPRQ